MALPNLNVVSKNKSGGVQQVEGVIVNMVNGEFVFNYNTSQDPAPDDLELLKNFRNLVVDELEKLNTIFKTLRP